MPVCLRLTCGRRPDRRVPTRCCESSFIRQPIAGTGNVGSPIGFIQSVASANRQMSRMEISWSKLADEIRQKIKSYTQLVDGWHVCKKSVSKLLLDP